jgi:hypothetical protein
MTGLENSNRISVAERALSPRNTGVSPLFPRTFCIACSEEQAQALKPGINRMIPHKSNLLVFDIIASAWIMRRS